MSIQVRHTSSSYFNLCDMWFYRHIYTAIFGSLYSSAWTDSTRPSLLYMGSSVSSNYNRHQQERISSLSKSSLVFTIFWSLLILSISFIANSAPYLLLGSLDAFIDGIRHNAQDLNPQSISSILYEQAKSIINMHPIAIFSLFFAAYSVILSINFKGPFPGEPRTQ